MLPHSVRTPIALTLVTSLLFAGWPAPAMAAPDPAPTVTSPVPTPPQIRVRVAVMDFRNINVPEGVGQAAAENLRSALIALGRESVIERGQIEQVLAEQRFGQTGLVDGSKAVELGKLLGVARIIVGSVTRMGSTYTLNARVIDVRTAEAMNAGSFSTRDENDLPQLVQQMASSLSGLPMAMIPATPPVYVAPANRPIVVSPSAAPVVAPVVAPPSLPVPPPTQSSDTVSTGQSKALALTLGLLFPGAGQFYGSNPAGGGWTMALVAGSILLGVVTAFMLRNGYAGGAVGMIVGGIVHVGGAIDAFNQTEEHRRKDF